MIEIGRVCVKTAGREAGRICVIVDVLGKPFVTIDGDVRRKKCNYNHLEFAPVKLDIKKGEAHEKVMEELKKAGYEIEARKKHEKKEGKKEDKKEKPMKKRKTGEKNKKAKKKEEKKSKAKKSEKKEEKHEEKKPEKKAKKEEKK